MDFLPSSNGGTIKHFAMLKEAFISKTGWQCYVLFFTNTVGKTHIDKFIVVEDKKPAITSKNPVMDWYYQDVIKNIQYDRYILVNKTWENDRDTMEVLRDVAGDSLGDRIVSKYSEMLDMTKDDLYELAVNAVTLPRGIE